MKKFPPIEKVYEAWTALADNRVLPTPDGATVESSDGAKNYIVKFRDNEYSSTDNATFWRGYAGYPVIALLMLQGKLPYNKEEAALWSDINWTALNKKHRNNYAAAVEEIEKVRGIDGATSKEAAEKVMEALSELPLVIKRKI